MLALLMSVWSVVCIYVRERFSVIPVLLLGTSYAALTRAANFHQASFTSVAIFIASYSGIFILFLLRLRIWDEFKDERYDLIHYPNRPLPSGRISKKFLTRMGLLVLLVELVFVWLMFSSREFFIYLLIVIYSIAMAKEFGIADWLQKHFTFYFLSHELIFLLWAWLGMSLTAFPFGALEEYSSQFVVLVLAPVTIELLRKFAPRYDVQGNPTDDSYSVAWGEEFTTAVVFILFAFWVMGLFRLGVPLGIGVIPLIFLGLSFFLNFPLSKKTLVGIICWLLLCWLPLLL